jgi:hypothetical protein
MSKDKKNSSSILGWLFKEKSARIDNGGSNVGLASNAADMTTQRESVYEGVVKYVKRGGDGVYYAFIEECTEVTGQNPPQGSISFSCVKPTWSQDYLPPLGMRVLFSNVVDRKSKKDPDKKLYRAMKVWPKPV